MAEIIEDFLVKRDKGYYCAYGDFYVDPLYPVQRAVVSHAHGDHASPGHREIYCTKATSAFMQVRYPKQPLQSYHVFDFEEGFNINGVEIVFIPAGQDRKSTRLNSSHVKISYAVFCLKKKILS